MDVLKLRSIGLSWSDVTNDSTQLTYIKPMSHFLPLENLRL